MGGEESRHVDAYFREEYIHDDVYKHMLLFPIPVLTFMAHAD